MSKNPTTPATKFPIIDIKNEDHSGTTTKMTRSHWLKCCTIRFRKKILAQEQSFSPPFHSIPFLSPSCQLGNNYRRHRICRQYDNFTTRMIEGFKSGSSCSDVTHSPADLPTGRVCR
ncbi:hypothetical protein NC651_033800 [Populus alba x Populus x berolinensis]|nr:hypothetical protein NC651_033800 [Populus alba x Populus x berolinensis]